MNLRITGQEYSALANLAMTVLETLVVLCWSCEQRWGWHWTVENSSEFIWDPACRFSCWEILESKRAHSEGFTKTFDGPWATSQLSKQKNYKMKC